MDIRTILVHSIPILRATHSTAQARPQLRLDLFCIYHLTHLQHFLSVRPSCLQLPTYTPVTPSLQPVSYSTQFTAIFPPCQQTLSFSLSLSFSSLRNSPSVSDTEHGLSPSLSVGAVLSKHSATSAVSCFTIILSQTMASRCKFAV